MVCCVCEGPTDGICGGCVTRAVEKLEEKELKEHGLKTKGQAEAIFWLVYGNTGPWYYEDYE